MKVVNLENNEVGELPDMPNIYTDQLLHSLGYQRISITEPVPYITNDPPPVYSSTELTPEIEKQMASLPDITQVEEETEPAPTTEVTEPVKAKRSHKRKNQTS